MDFKKFYTEQTIEEGPVSDVVNADAGTLAKAAVKGVGRGIGNVVKGALGQTKTMAFEPGWLKVLREMPIKTYQQTIKSYANWGNAKTKLGPKRNITIKDNRDAVLGDFTGNDFVDILKKYDPDMSQVNMDADIKPRMSVYILNNGGKVIFMELPVGEDGRKKKFAIGMDGKGERAFRLIHGMPFQDYNLKGDEEAGKMPETKKSDVTKYEIDKKQFDKMIPRKMESFSYIDSFDFINLFSENEIIDEAKKKKINFLKINDKIAISIEKGDWRKVYSSGGINNSPMSDSELEKNNFIAVRKNKDGEWEQDEELNNELKKHIEDLTGESPENKLPPSDSIPQISNENGQLYDDIKDYLFDPDVKKSIGRSKATDKVERGYVYRLKDNGKIYLYQNKENKKYYIAFDPVAEKKININDLIKKYGLEKSEDQPEEEAVESIQHGGKMNIKEKYINKANFLMDKLNEDMEESEKEESVTEDSTEENEEIQSE